MHTLSRKIPPPSRHMCKHPFMRELAVNMRVNHVKPPHNYFLVVSRELLPPGYMYCLPCVHACMCVSVSVCVCVCVPVIGIPENPDFFLRFRRSVSVFSGLMQTGSIMNPCLYF